LLTAFKERRKMVCLGIALTLLKSLC
jgi:hypothetical protein